MSKAAKIAVITELDKIPLSFLKRNCLSNFVLWLDCSILSSNNFHRGGKGSLLFSQPFRGGETERGVEKLIPEAWF